MRLQTDQVRKKRELENPVAAIVSHQAENLSINFAPRLRCTKLKAQQTIDTARVSLSIILQLLSNSQRLRVKAGMSKVRRQREGCKCM